MSIAIYKYLFYDLYASGALSLTKNLLGNEEIEGVSMKLQMARYIPLLTLDWYGRVTAGGSKRPL